MLYGIGEQNIGSLGKVVGWVRTFLAFATSSTNSNLFIFLFFSSSSFFLFLLATQQLKQPVYLVAMVLSSNLGGIITGEWKGTRLKSRLWMAAGLLLLAVSIAVSTVGSL